MSKVITTRVPDDAYDRLESIAIEHGLKIGEHTREVLAEHGFDQKQIEALEQEGVIVSASMGRTEQVA